MSIQTEDGKFIIPIEKWGPSRQPEESEITQVVKKMKKDYNKKIIVTLAKVAFLVTISLVCYEACKNLGGLWYVIDMLINLVIALLAINCFLKLDYFEYLLKLAKRGTFRVLDCKVSGICPALSSLSRKEAWELQSVINDIYNNNADIQLLKDLTKKFSKKHRKQIAMPYTEFHRTFIGIPTTNAIKKLWLINEDADFFIARFDYKATTLYMDLFTKQLS